MTSFAHVAAKGVNPPSRVTRDHLAIHEYRAVGGNRQVAGVSPAVRYQVSRCGVENRDTHRQNAVAWLPAASGMPGPFRPPRKSLTLPSGNLSRQDRGISKEISPVAGLEPGHRIF